MCPFMNNSTSFSYTGLVIRHEFSLIYSTKYLIIWNVFKLFKLIQWKTKFGSFYYFCHSCLTTCNLIYFYISIFLTKSNIFFLLNSFFHTLLYNVLILVPSNYSELNWVLALEGRFIEISLKKNFHKNLLNEIQILCNNYCIKWNCESSQYVLSYVHTVVLTVKAVNT